MVSAWAPVLISLSDEVWLGSRSQINPFPPLSCFWSVIYHKKRNKTWTAILCCSCGNEHRGFNQKCTPVQRCSAVDVLQAPPISLLKSLPAARLLASSICNHSSWGFFCSGHRVRCSVQRLSSKCQGVNVPGSYSIAHGSWEKSCSLAVLGCGTVLRYVLCHARQDST